MPAAFGASGRFQWARRRIAAVAATAGAPVSLPAAAASSGDGWVAAPAGTVTPAASGGSGGTLFTFGFLAGSNYPQGAVLWQGPVSVNAIQPAPAEGDCSFSWTSHMGEQYPASGNAMGRIGLELLDGSGNAVFSWLIYDDSQGQFAVDAKATLSGSATPIYQMPTRTASALYEDNWIASRAGSTWTLSLNGLQVVSAAGSAAALVSTRVSFARYSAAGELVDIRINAISFSGRSAGTPASAGNLPVIGGELVGSIVATDGTAYAQAVASAVLGNGKATNALLLGGQSGGAAVTTAENYLFASLGTKGAAPADLGSARQGVAMTANRSIAFAFGGYTGSANVNVVETYSIPGSPARTTLAAVLHATTAADSTAASSPDSAYAFNGTDGTVEKWSFSTPGTKGVFASALAVTARPPCASSNSSKAFVFGDSVTAGSAYSFATDTASSGPQALSSANLGNAAAAGNTVLALVFGGRVGAGPPPSVIHAISAVDTFAMATGVRTSGAAAMAYQRLGLAAASTDTNAFTFGGFTGLGVDDSVENYVLAAAGSTKGAAPIALSSARWSLSAASNRGL
jgi:hypothetical protein